MVQNVLIRKENYMDIVRSLERIAIIAIRLETLVDQGSEGHDFLLDLRNQIRIAASNCTGTLT